MVNSSATAAAAGEEKVVSPTLAVSKYFQRAGSAGRKSNSGEFQDVLDIIMEEFI